MIFWSESGSKRPLPPVVLIGLFIVVCLLECRFACAQFQGVVLNSETGRPLAKVELVLSADSPATGEYRVTSENDGSFRIDEVDPGLYQMMVLAVGFGLIKREVEIKQDEPTILEIHLSPGTALADEMTVTANLPRGTARLSATEINNLKSVLTDDSIRALQHLPSLPANDDFNTGFAMKGSGFDRVGILFDGVPAHSFVHTIQGEADTGSTTLLSAELIDGLDLVNAGSSARWSGNSAGFLDMRSRSGNRSRWRNLVSVSGSAFMFLSEGPVGRGSWIASARKSYVDWIIRRIEPDTELNFGYYDVFGKVTQMLNDEHELSVSYIHGNTALRDVAEGSGMNSLDRGRFLSDFFHLEWDWYLQDRLTSHTHFYYQRADSWNQNPQGAELWRNEEDVAGFRSVWDFRPFKNWTVSGGVTGERWAALNQQNFFQYGSHEWEAISFFDIRTNRLELFLEGSVPISQRVTLFGGWSWNHQSRLAAGYHSPYAGVEISPADCHRLSVWFGRSGQFPFFNQLYGVVGNSQLLPEAATGTEARWSYRGVEGFEFALSGYYRWRDDVPWRYQGLWRLEDGEIVPPSTDPYTNLLEDRSYGAEVSVGRRVTNGLSGWLGYAWGRSRWSEEQGVWFPGNYDQRHGLSVFVHYRWTSNVELSTKWRYASGMPLPVYAQKQGDRYYVAERRNQEFLPDYARFDARLAKSFPKDRYRITLFVEVLNLFDRENVRYAGHELGSVNPGTGRIRNLTSQQFPILPTAGIIFEF